MEDVTAPKTKGKKKYTVSFEIAERAKEALLALPDKRTMDMGLKDTAKTLYEPILSALEKNYTIEEITGMLEEHLGYKLSPSSARYFWKVFRDLKRERGDAGRVRAKRSSFNTSLLPDDKEADTDI